MTDDTEARAMVQEYLVAHFPLASIWDGADADASAHTWSVVEDAVIMLLSVSAEFLRDVPPSSIDSRLGAWNVAEALRLSGAHERVIVTTAGLRTEPRT